MLNLTTHFVVQSCQLNAYFVDAELELGSHLAQALGGAPNGTFIQAFAFQYGSQSIVAEVDRVGKMTCTPHFMLCWCPLLPAQHPHRLASGCLQSCKDSCIFVASCL